METGKSSIADESNEAATIGTADRASRGAASSTWPITEPGTHVDALLDELPVSVCIVEGREHTVTFANSASLSAFGGADPRGRSLARDYPDLEKQFGRFIDQVLDTGEPLVIQEMAIEVPGRSPGTNVHAIYKPRRDRRGALQGVLVCGFDVSEQVAARRRAEAATEAWRFSEMQFRLAIRSSGLVVFGQDLALRHVWIHNPVPGFTAEGIVGKSDRELHLPVNAERLESVKRRALAGQSVREEIELEWPEGARHFQLTAEPHHDETGAIDGLIGACLDITDQVRARQHLGALTAQLGDSELQFRTLADSIPQLAWIAEPSGDVHWYNQRWYDYTGTALADVAGWEWQSVHDPAELPRVIRGFRAALAAGTPWEDTFPLRRKDGAYEWFLSRAMPVRDASGAIVRWFGTNTNVDEHRRQAAALKTAVDLRDDFLSIAGHELKTPLAALLMHIQSIQRARQAHASPLKLDERLVKAASAGARLDKLINQMLEVSRITSGRLQLDCETFSLEDVLHDIIERVAEQAERAGSTITLRIASRMRGSWDRLRIDQVFTNLIGNALKYGNGQPIDVELAGRDGGAEVKIIDHGIGIPQNQQHKIFDRFERAVGTREFGGFGLGLWICRQIVEASSGRIAVVSTPGSGSTFTVWLPHVAAEATRG